MHPINKPGTKIQTEIDAALNTLTRGQVWNYGGHRHQLITFNRAYGLVKTYDLTSSKRDAICVAALVKRGTQES